MANKCPKCDTENTQDSQFCKTCATPLPVDKGQPSFTKTLETPVSELTRGALFADRYEIIEELGTGGMGKVYRVEDKKAKEEIAIKLIRPEVAADKKIIDRFRNELTTARKIRHKNVCGMYDLGEYEGTHFITMEYVTGEDLKSLIRRVKQIPIGTTISIAKQICEGLTEAHGLGVVHRDLKSSNIMIDKDGKSRIMDFGIARSLKTKGITGAGVIIGTPEYMSPEQVDGIETDQRSDVYSLGIILYEMVTGQLPFEGDTPLSIAYKHKHEAPQDPRKINAQIPEDLNGLILRCLEKDKENRYQSSDELRAELENIEKGIPTTQIKIERKIPLTSKEITVTFRLKKFFVPALIVLAVVIIVLILWNPWTKKGPALISSDKPTLAIVYFENNTGDENMDRWRNGLANLLIDDLSQSKLISVLSGDRLYTVLKKINLLEANSYSSDDLKNVAEQAGVQNILRGRLDKAGNIVRISTTLENIVTEDLLETRRIDTQGEEGFLDAVDELTRMIKTDLSLNTQDIASDIDKEVGKITTSYPEAYKNYSEGRKYHLSGDYRQNISFMERAIEIDPEFAMAYRSLAAAHNNLGNIAERKKYNKKAFELSNQASDIERYWIQGDYYRIEEKNFNRAIEAYNKMIELGPYNPAAQNNIARIYEYLEEWDKAIEHLEVSRKNKGAFIGGYENLGYYYEAKGMYQKAREVYLDYINNFSDVALIHARLSKNYACEGKYDLALEEADKAIKLDPTSYSKGGIYHLQGDFNAAEKDYERWLEVDNEVRQLQGRRWLEVLYRTQGQFEKAKEQAQLGLELSEKFGRNSWKCLFHFHLGYIYFTTENLEKASQEFSKQWDIAFKNDLTGYQHWALYSKGMALIEMKSMNETKKAADELKQLIEGSIAPKNIRLYHNLMGRIEFEKKNYSRAIDYFKKAYSEMPAQRRWGDDHAMFIYSLGLAYYMSGDLDKAQEEYGKILAMTTGRLYQGDLYVKSYNMLGNIHEQQGDTAKAIEHYQKFLDLWKDADPGIAEVEDARKRLGGLRGQ